MESIKAEWTERVEGKSDVMHPVTILAFLPVSEANIMVVFKNKSGMIMRRYLGDDNFKVNA